MQSRDCGVVLMGTANCENATNVRSIKGLVIVSVKQRRLYFIEFSDSTHELTAIRYDMHNRSSHGNIYDKLRSSTEMPTKASKVAMKYEIK